jgi:hypothetical protein
MVLGPIDRCSNSTPISTTAGPSQTMRASLARAAAPAASGDTDEPAPATWATSWMERPKNTPAW